MTLSVFYLILTFVLNNLMKKSLIIAALTTLIFSSCSRGITVYQAANGKAKCGRTYIK